MKKMILLFSHKLSKEQIEDAKRSLGVEEFVELNEETLKLWGNIPADLDEIDKFLLPIKDFISKSSQKGDYVLTQGDSGAVVKMVHFAQKKGLIPIYATTKREVEESVVDGKVRKVSLFKHVKFRRY